MTSGEMNCPKCGESFRYMEYEKRGAFIGLVDIPEPWECPKCKSLIIVDRKMGYGLTTKPKDGKEERE